MFLYLHFVQMNCLLNKVGYWSHCQNKVQEWSQQEEFWVFEKSPRNQHTQACLQDWEVWREDTGLMTHIASTPVRRTWDVWVWSKVVCTAHSLSFHLLKHTNGFQRATAKPALTNAGVRTFPQHTDSSFWINDHTVTWTASTMWRSLFSILPTLVIFELLGDKHPGRYGVILHDFTSHFSDDY